MSDQPEAGATAAEGRMTAVLRGVCSLCMAGLVGLVCALILLRIGLFSVSLAWTDEVIELLFAWMVFLGAAIVWGKREHIVVDVIPQMLAGTEAGRLLELLCCILALGFLVVFTWQGYVLTMQAWDNTSPILVLPRPLWYAAMPVAGVMMIWHTLRQTAKAVRAVASHGTRDAGA